MIEQIIGKRLLRIGCAADMIWLSIDEFALDIQTKTEFYLNDSLIISSDEIYEELVCERDGKRAVTGFDKKSRNILTRVTTIRSYPFSWIQHSIWCLSFLTPWKFV